MNDDPSEITEIIDPKTPRDHILGVFINNHEWFGNYQTKRVLAFFVFMMKQQGVTDGFHFAFLVYSFRQQELTNDSKRNIIFKWIYWNC